MSSVSFMPLQFDHLAYLDPHPSQVSEYEALLGSAGESLVQRSMGMSAWHRGRCVFVGGICLVWQGRAELWAICGASLGANVHRVVRHGKFVLDGLPHRRIEMLVKVDNEQGNRLAQMLGFDRPEGVLRAYHPDGSDMHMYARIKPWRQ
jgi:hypothetical protein